LSQLVTWWSALGWRAVAEEGKFKAAGSIGRLAAHHHHWCLALPAPSSRDFVLVAHRQAAEARLQHCSSPLT